MGSPEQVGGPSGAAGGAARTTVRQGSARGARGARGEPGEPQGSARGARGEPGEPGQPGQSQGTFEHADAQELLLLGRFIGPRPPPLLLLVLVNGHDGVTHDVHLGVENGGTSLKLGPPLTVAPRPLVEVWTARARLLSVQSSQLPAGLSEEAGLPSCGAGPLGGSGAALSNRLVHVSSALLLDRSHQARLLERLLMSLFAE